MAKRFKTKEELQNTPGVTINKHGTAIYEEKCSFFLYPKCFGKPVNAPIEDWKSEWTEDWMVTEDPLPSEKSNQTDTSGALRYDSDKLRMDLIPPEWLIELARVLTKGAVKYEDNNWKKGMKYSRGLGSLKRHLVKWELGDTLDNETGCHHLASVAWNALALMYWDMNERSDLDDRHTSNIYNTENLECK